MLETQLKEGVLIGVIMKDEIASLKAIIDHLGW